jgi:hypothetical protein
MSGLLIFIEIQESSLDMMSKPYRREHQATTASTLRLTGNWHGSGRLVAGDSWFASYATAKALLDHGLEFQGIIKTAHAKYPMRVLRGAFNNDSLRGAAEYVKTQVTVQGGSRTIWGFALNEPGYRGEKKKPMRKYLIASCGTSLEDADGCWMYKKRVREDEQGNMEDYEKKVRCPPQFKSYWDCSATIDIFNHLVYASHRAGR